MANLIQDGGQQMKFAAMEGDFEDTAKPVGGTSIVDYEEAPATTSWSVIAFFNEREHKRVWSLDIPIIGSFLTYHRFGGGVPGMITLNKRLVEMYGEDNYFPAVTTLFYSFRIMVFSGIIFALIGFIGFLATTFYSLDFILGNRKMLKFIAFCTFLPFVANSLGWIITELGRQPWIVFGLFRTRDAISPNVSAASLLASNIIYFLLFATLGGIMVYLARFELRRGPYPVEEAAKATVDPFDKEAF